MTRPTFRERGYTARWDRERREFLRINPWCVMCSAEGRGTRATVVDHRIPHRGDERLMWAPSNWQPLCGPCHNSTKQQQERRGYSTRVRCDGMPSDPRHPFLRGDTVTLSALDTDKARHQGAGGATKSPARKGEVPHGSRRLQFFTAERV